MIAKIVRAGRRAFMKSFQLSQNVNIRELPKGAGLSVRRTK